MKITLEEIQVFLTVVDSGSLTAAARELGLTVSAASRSLGRLEDKLQTELLRRTTRRMVLTEEGNCFLSQARAIQQAVENAEKNMAALRGQPAGRLRVDAATPFMLHVVAPLVPGYRERHPLIDLELTCNEGVIDLLGQRTDLALRIGPLKDSTLRSRLIGYSRLRLLASPAYLQRQGVPRRAADLARHTLLGFNQPETLNRWPVRGLTAAVSPALRVSSGETLRQLALHGAGIVCLSDFMTGEDRAQGRLLPLLENLMPGARQPVHAVYYRNSGIPARIATFVDYLVQAVRDGHAPLDPVAAR